MPELERTTATTEDGTELAIQQLGRGPALLLIQGQANSHRWWRGLRERFAERFTTITFDYRGTGTTRADEDREATQRWNTRQFAQDARFAIDATGNRKAHVYGASMGGRVAQWLAIDHPEVTDHLVLACTSPGGDAAVERGPDVRRQLAQRDPGARRDTLIDLFYTPAWRAQGKRSALLGDPTMSARARTGHLRASDTHDAAGRLPEIAAPTLVLHGTDDRMAPVANAHTIHGLIPGSRLSLTEGGRHGFFDEFSSRVTADVLDFLA